MLKIRIDATSVTPDQSAGVETFAYGLVSALSRSTDDVSTSVMTRRGDRDAWRQRVGLTVEIQGVPVGVDLQSGPFHTLRRLSPAGLRSSRALEFMRHLRSRSIARRSGVSPGVTYYPFHRNPITADRAVMTAHDFRVFTNDHSSGADQRIIAKNFDRAAAVVASWPHPFEDAARLFPQHRDKTFLVPLPVFNPPEATPTAPTSRSLLLYPASTAPHKNHERLIRAVAEVPGASLVCAGPNAEPRATRLRSLVRELGVEDRVTFTGFVTTAQLQDLFSRCAAVVVPTLWEAASGPVFEGLAWKKPVLASDISPIRSQLQLVGAGASLFDPLDVADIASVVRRTIADLEPLTAAAQQFDMWLSSRTWDDVAADYVEIFQWVCGQAERPTHLQSGQARRRA